jgi:hypothetical protein
VIEDANLDSCSAKHGYELFKTKADYFSPERIERYTMGDFSNMNHYVRKIFQYENELQSIGFAILPKTKKMKQLVKKDLDEANEWLTEFEKTILKKT